MLFYLGTHMANWLSLLDFPLFVSRVRLARFTRTKNLPKALSNWALDSGGFTELNKYGKWTVGEKQYIEEIKKYQEYIGKLNWAAAQDWMCEPFVLSKTGKSIKEHQELTINNFINLNELNPSVPITPVLQGWGIHDYLDHIEQYLNRNIDLRQYPVVGIGSVCRRQHTDEAENIIKTIKAYGIKLHGFGFKVKGLLKVKDDITSSDSMSWSLNARKNPKLLECMNEPHTHCGNCIKYAAKWRNDLIRKLNNE